MGRIPILEGHTLYTREQQMRTGDYRSFRVVIQDEQGYISLSLLAKLTLYHLFGQLSQWGIRVIHVGHLEAQLAATTEDLENAFRELEREGWLLKDGRTFWLIDVLDDAFWYQHGNPKHTGGLTSYLGGLPQGILPNLCALYYGVSIPHPGARNGQWQTIAKEQWEGFVAHRLPGRMEMIEGVRAEAEAERARKKAEKSAGKADEVRARRRREVELEECDDPPFE